MGKGGCFVVDMDRRKFLAGLGAAAAIVGFDGLSRRWVASAEAGEASFDAIPPLDGQLLTTYPRRAASSFDQGNIVHVLPHAVLLPGSVADIQKMVRFCRARGIKVAARGQHHTTFGQSLSPGLAIEMRSLATIHAIGPGGADVDGGVLWRDLTEQAFEQGLSPPVLTGYIRLSIAGTLSVGGVSSANRRGLQIDRVQELEVVTGAGELVTCSPTQERELFEAVLGGLGQFGVITRARVDLVPVPPRALMYTLHYAGDLDVMLRDMRILLERGEFDDIYVLWLPNGSALVPELTATVYFDPANPPPPASHLFRGLSPFALAAVPQDQPYLEYVTRVDTLIDALEASLQWSELVKPWFDVWLPDRAMEGYVKEATAEVTGIAAGPGGFVLLFPQLRSALRRELYPVPPPGAGKWVFLFDILPASPTPDPGRAYVAEWLARNRRLYEKARDAGGTRYAIGAVEFSKQDWRRQYGGKWAEFARRKATYDPANIMTPGPGIF